MRERGRRGGHRERAPNGKRERERVGEKKSRERGRERERGRGREREREKKAKDPRVAIADTKYMLVVLYAGTEDMIRC